MEGIEFEVRIAGVLERGASPEAIKAKIVHMAQNIGKVSLTEVTFGQNLDEPTLGSAGSISQNRTTGGLDTQVSRTGWAPELDGFHWRMLSAIDQEPNLNSKELKERLGYGHQSAISRAGAKLSEEGYVTKQRVGRMVLWETTSLGSNYLARRDMVVRSMLAVGQRRSAVANYEYRFAQVVDTDGEQPTKITLEETRSLK